MVSQRALAHVQMGEASFVAGDLNTAIQHFRMAVRYNPGDAVVLSQLGIALYQSQRSRESLVALRSAVALSPKMLSARVGLGTLFCAIEDYDQAIFHLEIALELDAKCAPAWFNLGCAHLGLGCYQDAVQAFNRVLALHPEWAAARLNRALTWLSAGNFKLGLPEYEWRLRVIDRDFSRLPPRWDGRLLSDQTLLVYVEQGLGDTLNFLRFVPLVLKRAPKLVFSVQPALFPLLAPVAKHWGVRLLDTGAAIEEVDYSCPLLSLPWVLGVSLASPVPGVTLQPPQEYRKKWHGRLSTGSKPTIGIAWSGNRRPYDVRPIALSVLAPLLALDAFEWVVLQTEVAAEDKAYLQTSAHAGRVHYIEQDIADMADTAAVIAQLDAVVSIDTSVAHLAGTMGKPVFMMLPFAADWRWRIDDQRSRWYPTARLVRQTSPGDWASAVRQLVERLPTEVS